MSELCYSGNSKNQELCILVSDFILFICFNLTHPVHFSFFIFFSPYLIKLLPSFLSPLFFSTFLLLTSLSLFPRLVQDLSDTTSLSSKVKIFLSHYLATVERLHREEEDEPEEFNVPENLGDYYKLLFDTTSVEIWDSKLDENSSEPPHEASSVAECASDELDKVNASDVFADNSEEIASSDREERASSEGNFFEEFDEFESVSSNVDEKDSNSVTDSRRFVVDANGAEGIGSELESGKTNTAVQCDLGSYGSMRREKEWKKTLACKLFEERRHVDGGGEGMDLLWETYELDSSKSNQLEKKSCKKKSKNRGKTKPGKVADKDDDEEEEMDGKICCLQALKFSAGKMNLGMGRPNLVKISKVFKGLGWLSSSSGRRNGKKVYNSDRL